MRKDSVPLTRLGQGEFARECNGDGEGSTLLWFAALAAVALAIVAVIEVYEVRAARGAASVSAVPAAAAQATGGAQ
jgi:hypothetical protein